MGVLSENDSDNAADVNGAGKQKSSQRGDDCAIKKFWGLSTSDS